MEVKMKSLLVILSALFFSAYLSGCYVTMVYHAVQSYSPQSDCSEQTIDSLPIDSTPPYHPRSPKRPPHKPPPVIDVSSDLPTQNGSVLRLTHTGRGSLAGNYAFIRNSSPQGETERSNWDVQRIRSESGQNSPTIQFQDTRIRVSERGMRP
jgi:hypothetical protein